MYKFQIITVIHFLQTDAEGNMNELYQKNTKKIFQSVFVRIINEKNS